MMKRFLGDPAAVVCVLIAATVEACIYSGLIPSNTRYKELMRLSTVSSEITDCDLNICYATGNLQTAPRETLKKLSYLMFLWAMEFGFLLHLFPGDMYSGKRIFPNWKAPSKN